LISKRRGSIEPFAPLLLSQQQEDSSVSPAVSFLFPSFPLLILDESQLLAAAISFNQ
jgi:hypothetical protein